MYYQLLTQFATAAALTLILNRATAGVRLVLELRDDLSQADRLRRELDDEDEPLL